MAVDSATAAGPQPQARSKAEDGRTRVSCLARNARTARRGRKSQTGHCGIEAGDPERKPGERIAALDPPAAGRKGALVLKPSR